LWFFFLNFRIQFFYLRCPRTILILLRNWWFNRENQHKRVVQHVKEDGLSSDMWAWRKYGQKPIKGSPYPR
jgi:hypothetical protein